MSLKLCCRLAVITGLSWLLGLVAGWADFRPLWHIFVVFNTLQGVFIFCSFTVRAARSSARHRLSYLAPWSTAEGRRTTGTGQSPASDAAPTSETEI